MRGPLAVGDGVGKILPGGGITDDVGADGDLDDGAADADDRTGVTDGIDVAEGAELVLERAPDDATGGAVPRD